MGQLECVPSDTMNRRTPTKSIAMRTASTTKTARRLTPPRTPAATGLNAMPTSDALVRTPKPAPCVPGGMTSGHSVTRPSSRCRRRDRKRRSRHSSARRWEPLTSSAPIRRWRRLHRRLMTAAALIVIEQLPAQVMSDRAGKRSHREHDAGRNGHVIVPHADLLADITAGPARSCDPQTAHEDDRPSGRRNVRARSHRQTEPVFSVFSMCAGARSIVHRRGTSRERPIA